jgi:hypothetical protein
VKIYIVYEWNVQYFNPYPTTKKAFTDKAEAERWADEQNNTEDSKEWIQFHSDDFDKKFIVGETELVTI